MKLRFLYLIVLTFISVSLSAQQVDLNTIGSTFQNKPISLSGGLALSNVFYNGNQASGRQNWTYALNGTVNVNIYEKINIPLSMNLTNLGANLQYPSLPNRLSIHPTYKWITAHIGDVSMSFSPYTLNGHQFTGAGVDLTPDGRFKISLMGGQLLRKVEYNSENPYVMPNFKRLGAGAKVQYDTQNLSLGAIYFTAKDKEDEAMYISLDSLGISPKQNHAVSFSATMNFIDNLSLSIEYALSLLTRDVRSPHDDSNFFDKISGNKISTSAYHAFNTRLSYQLTKNTISFGYERIDPEYATLGAYYFNNDYENITINYARPFLKGDKANIALSFGVQQDNLNKAKEETATRYVGSASLAYAPSEKLQLNFNYSTFQSYRNVRSQFDYINELSPYDNLDTLNYSQLSQNLDASLMYTFKNTEKQAQRMSLMASYQESADQQGGIALPGNVSRFLNIALGYGIQFIPQAVSVTSSLNSSYNYGAMIEAYTFGPTVGVTAALLKSTLSTGLSTSYNVSINDGNTQAKVFSLRANAGYRLGKRHRFTANCIWQNRNLPMSNSTYAVTSTIAYAFSF